jgi:NADH-quinone oxidoreductase subunit B
MAEGSTGLEVRREKLRRGRRPEGAPRGRSPHAPLDEPATPEDFRARQLRARDLLRGDLEGRELERHVEESVATTKWERALGWARANSVFPLTFGLACCAIEMISLVTPRYDIARFGAENMRASPRQADLLILSGRVSIKMAPVVRRIYDQMLEPKWAIAMGACSSSGGMFANYAVVQGADKFMPVDVHVPGCPPRPEALISGFNKLQRKIEGNPDPGWRQRYNAIGTEEWARGATEPTQDERDAYTAARELTREMASAPGSDGA